MSDGLYVKPNLLAYRMAQVVSGVLAVFVFRRKFVRNEIKGVEGPYVVIANHEASLDFVNLIGATKKRLTFVISNSFFNSLPVNGILKSLGVIPKQQFQTSVSDMRKIKAVIDNGQSLVIYPAGLMCEDGVSTPIPEATYKFLKWLDTDVYVARTMGTYFSMPKWTKGIRAGRTYLDIYKLISKEELKAMKVSEIKEKADKALLFNAYLEQEKFLIKYKNNSNIEGLENVLYMCPHCMSEFTVRIRDKSTIYCTECGYEENCDEYAFLHNDKGIGRELRYVSDWSRLIYEKLKEHIRIDPTFSIASKTHFHMINFAKHKFEEVGHGEVRLSKKHFNIKGIINGESVDLDIPSAKIPALPFSPGRHLEIQHGQDIYRCVLEDGRLVMKFINALKAFYELSNPLKT